MLSYKSPGSQVLSGAQALAARSTSIVDDEKNDRNTNTVDSGDGKDTVELIYINVQ